MALKIAVISEQAHGRGVARILEMDASLEADVRMIPPGTIPVERPDLVILCVEKPELNPSIILQEFARRDMTRGVPFILIAGWPYSFEVQMASSLEPIRGLLRLPLDPDELRITVQQALRPASTESKSSLSVQSDVEFLRRFCHDANNFLEVIISSSSFLDDESYPDDVRQLTRSITRASQDLARYIRRGALLQGPLSEGIREVKIEKMIHELVDEIQEEYPRVNFLLDQVKPVCCLANRTDLRVVLEELLRNATETVEAGSDRDIAVTLDRNADGQIQVIVENAGSLPDRSVLEASKGTTRDRRHHRGIGWPMLEAVTRRNHFHLDYTDRSGRVYAELKLSAEKSGADPEPADCSVHCN